MIGFCYLAHEGFHDYQEDTWSNDYHEEQDIAGYPLSSEHLAMIKLEDRVLAKAMDATRTDQLEFFIKQFLAIREKRINNWYQSRQLDLSQERSEGTALYLEYRLEDMLSTNSNQAMPIYGDEYHEAEGIREFYAFD